MINQKQAGNNGVNRHEDEDSIDKKKLIFKFLYNWHWFVLSIIFAGSVAFLYNRYTTPVYDINTMLLIKQPKTGASNIANIPGSGIFQDFGMLSGLRNINNQMVILSSTPLVRRTLQELGFEVSYYSMSRIAVFEAYKSVPFQVIWEESHPQIIETVFDLEIMPDGKLLVSAEGEDAAVYSYKEEKVIKTIPEFSFSRETEPGVRLVSDEFAFTILLNERFSPQALNKFRFRFHTKESLIKKYRNNLSVELPEKETSILNLTLRDQNVQKGIDFLSKLTGVFQLDNLGKKNENASRTVQFISSQLQTISDSLTISEDRMEIFQSDHQLLDISLQSQQLLELMRELDQERVAMETQNKYYHYLREYINIDNQQTETIIAPSAMGIQDPLLNSLILQLNELITEKSSQTSIRANSQHPTILRINAQIESVTNSLKENVNNIISQSDMALENLNQRIRRYEAQVSRVPATERNYVNIERKYKLNNEIYTFLLQKLSEAQIAKASNISDTQVIEEAQMVGTGPVAPKKMMVYAIALLLGLAFPTLIIFVHDFFNTKIMSQEDVEAITKYPIIGHVFKNDKNFASRTLVLDKPNSPASEPYRAIRTKLNFLTKGKTTPVIAVTSAFPKEGKSYNAINIASALALSNKKVVLLDLDLRNSKMADEFNLDSGLGVVNYIIGRAGLDEITYNTKHPRLKLIPAGPIPPNPSEMLIDENLYILIEKLKEDYDAIVIDTPPVGYVADLYQLHNVIDANIFIVRHKFTHKQALKMALEEIEKHPLKGVGIIINSINPGK
jgi:tyrosine-protein kinase Etk/Wzc